MPGPFTPRKPNLSKGELARRRRVFFAALAAAAAEGDKDNSGGGPPAPVAPGDLDNLVMHVEYASFVHPGSTPTTPTKADQASGIVNLASEVYIPTWEVPATNRPYLFTQDWDGTDAAPQPDVIPLPGGESFFGTHSGYDSGVPNSSYMETRVIPEIPTSVEWSGMTIFYFPYNDRINRYIMGFGSGTGRGISHNSDEGVIYNGADIGTVNCHTGPLRGWSNEWLLLTWSKVSGDFKQAINGVELALANSMAGAVTPYTCGQLWDGNNLTSLFALTLIYKEGHSLEDLNTVAEVQAARFGITSYSYTPLP